LVCILNFTLLLYLFTFAEFRLLVSSIYLNNTGRIPNRGSVVGAEEMLFSSSGGITDFAPNLFK